MGPSEAHIHSQALVCFAVLCCAVLWIWFCLPLDLSWTHMPVLIIAAGLVTSLAIVCPYSLRLRVKDVFSFWLASPLKWSCWSAHGRAICVRVFVVAVSVSRFFTRFSVFHRISLTHSHRSHTLSFCVFSPLSSRSLPLSLCLSLPLVLRLSRSQWVHWSVRFFVLFFVVRRKQFLCCSLLLCHALRSCVVVCPAHVYGMKCTLF